MSQTRDRLFSRKTLALFLEVSTKTIDRWTKENFIPHIRLRGRVLYSKKKILKWLEGFEVTGRDWETEFLRNSMFLSVTPAKQRFRRKKRIRKLYIQLSDSDDDETLSEDEIDDLQIKILDELCNLLEQECESIEKEISEVSSFRSEVRRSKEWREEGDE